MGLDERSGNPFQYLGVGHGRLTSQWRYTHNYHHHVFTNVVGVDADLGFGVLRVTRDQKWRPVALLQPLFAVLLGMAFEWGIALYGVIRCNRKRPPTPAELPRNRQCCARWLARPARTTYSFPP